MTGEAARPAARRGASPAALASLLRPRREILEAAARRGVYLVAPLSAGGLLCDPSLVSRNAAALGPDDLEWIAAFADEGGLELAAGPAVLDAARAAAVLRSAAAAGRPAAAALAEAAALARTGFMGTDGARGAVEDGDGDGGDWVSDFFGSARLRPELVRVAARAYGLMMIEERRARIGDAAVLAEDGRDLARGGAFKAALACGLGEAGLSVLDLGVAPTPCVPWFMLRKGLACGAMLTASHNPAGQNGVKFFLEGRKLLPEGPVGDLALSGRMYREYLAGREYRGRPKPARPSPARSALVLRLDIGEEAAAFTASALGAGAARRLRGLRLAADAAAGAAHSLLRRVLAELGIDGRIVSPEPEGSNINRGCGVAELEGRENYAAREAGEAPAVVRELFARGRSSGRPEWGMALDGDGDRGFVLAYDPGRDEVAVANGDRAGALLAARAAARGAAGDFVVSVESDPMCARYAREELGLRPEVVSVGDKWLGSYSKGPLLIGVEPSGHVVAPLSVAGPGGEIRELRAGNGIFTCLAAIDAALELGLDPARAVRPYEPGFCRTYYTYFVAKARFFPGSEAWERSAEAIASAFGEQLRLGAIPAGAELSFQRMEDPFTLYAAVLVGGSQAAAAFCRNSGTEDKIAAYVQCPAPWSAAFAAIGEALAAAHRLSMRDESRPEHLAAEAIVAALRDIGSGGVAEGALAAAGGEAAAALPAPSLSGVLAGLVKEGRASIRDGRVFAAGRP